MLYPDVETNRIIREVMPIRGYHRPEYYREITYSSFEEAFDAFEKMYSMDKMLYQTALRNHPEQEHTSDCSWHYDSYTFTINGQILTVVLKTAKDVANNLFCFES